MILPGGTKTFGVTSFAFSRTIVSLYVQYIYGWQVIESFLCFRIVLKHYPRIKTVRCRSTSHSRGLCMEDSRWLERDQVWGRVALKFSWWTISFAACILLFLHKSETIAIFRRFLMNTKHKRNVALNINGRYIYFNVLCIFSAWFQAISSSWISATYCTILWRELTR